ncbi:MAG: uracil-DNA glycosylase [Elusimicrobiaceae bacterium]|nr:uracil-DNA glycosylase [Elusimicrobiaceae bacterium]
MKENVRTLAADLKAFLASRQEDDLIPAAFSQAAAFVPSDTPKPDTLAQQDHLTVEFVRAAKHPATTSTKQTPVTAQTISESSSPVNEEKMPMSDVQTALDQIAKEIHECRRCPLGNSRLHAVPGEGNPHAQLMFIGEGPGFDEDHQGRPFIGRAGQLLDKMIVAMGLKREQVFIANIAKCHPMIHPENPEAHGNDRAPNAGEIAVCRKFIERQIAAISPKYVVALGGVAAKALISDTKSLGALRGQFHLLHLDSVELKKPVKILATYHPAALLRNPNWKKDAWADLQMVMAEMGLKRPNA